MSCNNLSAVFSCVLWNLVLLRSKVMYVCGDHGGWACIVSRSDARELGLLNPKHNYSMDLNIFDIVNQ